MHTSAVAHSPAVIHNRDLIKALSTQQGQGILYADLWPNSQRGIQLQGADPQIPPPGEGVLHKLSKQQSQCHLDAVAFER